jgi:hypothetical protein
LPFSRSILVLSPVLESTLSTIAAVGLSPSSFGRPGKAVKAGEFLQMKFIMVQKTGRTIWKSL